MRPLHVKLGQQICSESPVARNTRCNISDNTNACGTVTQAQPKRLRDWDTGIGFCATPVPATTGPESPTPAKRLRFDAPASHNGSDAAHRDSSSSRPPAHRPVSPSSAAGPPTSITLRKQYVNQIQSGAKTVEGRINTGMFTRVRAGDKLRFFYHQAPSDDAVVTVTQVNRYRSFREMLQAEGVAACLPGVTSVEAGARVYDGIPGYAERAQRSGVLALRIERL